MWCEYLYILFVFFDVMMPLFLYVLFSIAFYVYHLALFALSMAVYTAIMALSRSFKVPVAVVLINMWVPFVGSHRICIMSLFHLFLF